MVTSSLTTLMHPINQVGRSKDRVTPQVFRHVHLKYQCTSYFQQVLILTFSHTVLSRSIRACRLMLNFLTRKICTKFLIDVLSSIITSENLYLFIKLSSHI